MSARAPEEPSLRDLFGDLAKQTGKLVGQEIRLAKTEIRASAKDAVKDTAWTAAGVAAAVVGSIFLLVTVVLLLAEVMPAWAATLIVGGVMFFAGVGAVIKGVTALRKVDPMPRATIQTLKEDSQWVRAELSR